MKNFTRLTAGIVAVSALGALTLTGCSADAEPENTMGEIKIGYLAGWQDATTMAFLVQDQFVKLGYDVELVQLTEAGPLYTGLAQGDIDLYASAWPEVTQTQYMDQYGDDLEDLGTFFDEGTNTISVPEYMTDVNSIEDLIGQGERFDGKIFTIEPGSGTAAVARDMVMPEYGLDEEYELVTSSTPGMLAELDTAVAAEEPIVVTLWKPYWANGTLGMKELDDPRGGLGPTEKLHFLGHKGFAEEFPEAAELLAHIDLNDGLYDSLEYLLANDFKDFEADGVAEWFRGDGADVAWAVEAK